MPCMDIFAHSVARIWIRENLAIVGKKRKGKTEAKASSTQNAGLRAV